VTKSLAGVFVTGKMSKLMMLVICVRIPVNIKRCGTRFVTKCHYDCASPT
jgi:hypothetical protein